MSNVTDLSNYTQTTVAAPVAPSTTSAFDIELMAPLVRELNAKTTVEEPKLQAEITSARSFYTGDTLFQSTELLSQLKFGQQLRVNIEKDQNPLSLFNKKAVEYDAIDACHDQIQLDCTVPCVNTLPEFEHIVFRFDTEYSYGVKACDKNEDFYDLGYYTKQYAKSRTAEQFGREIDLWNTVIRGLIAAPATTVDAALAQTHPTHFWDNLGTVATAGRKAVTEAYWYMVNNYSGLNPTVFVTQEFANEIINSAETSFNFNTNLQVVNTFKAWEVPGFMVSSAVETIFGGQIPVVVMKRSPWLTTGTGTLATQFPLWNADATKQYVAILDPRVGYQIAKAGKSYAFKPYDCDHLYNTMIDTEYVGSGITFPMMGMVLAFTPYTYA